MKLLCGVESGRAGWGLQVELRPQVRGVSGGRTGAHSVGRAAAGRG